MVCLIRARLDTSTIHLNFGTQGTSCALPPIQRLHELLLCERQELGGLDVQFLSLENVDELHLLLKCRNELSFLEGWLERDVSQSITDLLGKPLVLRLQLVDSARRLLAAVLLLCRLVLGSALINRHKKCKQKAGSAACRPLRGRGSGAPPRWPGLWRSALVSTRGHERGV